MLLLDCETGCFWFKMLVDCRQTRLKFCIHYELINGNWIVTSFSVVRITIRIFYRHSHKIVCGSMADVLCTTARRCKHRANHSESLLRCSVYLISLHLHQSIHLHRQIWAGPTRPAASSSLLKQPQPGVTNEGRQDLPQLVCQSKFRFMNYAHYVLYFCAVFLSRVHETAA